MYTKLNPRLVTNPASLVIVGEISHTLRAQGNVCATGLIPTDTDADSPIRSGVYTEIPQAQIGFMDYGSFTNLTNNFIDMSGDRDPWNIVSANSMDSIFYPFNTFSDSGRVGPYMPYWTDPEDETLPGNSLTLNPWNPFNKLRMNTQGHEVESDPWTSGGHNLNMALFYNPLDSGEGGLSGYVGISGIYPSGSGSPVDFYFEKDHWARHTVETTGIRAVGFKAPMTLTGWGYDVDGYPVPSETGDISKFHEESSWNPHLWKSGPVDLRWDYRRGVWTGNHTRLFLCKLTNLFTPPSFSFEVDRSNSRDQYTRNAPASVKTFNPTGVLYDPEYLAYQNQTDNSTEPIGYYEQLDYLANDGDGNPIQYPYYEAFIIRETNDSPVPYNNFYNIWTNDCNDCGHITNTCGGGHGQTSRRKKVLIENPLRQAFDVGDLAFTINTGRHLKVNTGTYSGGTGSGAEATLLTNASGNLTFRVDAAGSGYNLGAFAVMSTGSKICANVILAFTDGELTGANLQPTGGFPASQEVQLDIYPYDATANTESLPIHWVVQSEFKSQQVVTHVECDNGILQTCTMKLQTQGYKTCEWCGEDTALINN